MLAAPSSMVFISYYTMYTVEHRVKSCYQSDPSCKDYDVITDRQSDGLNKSSKKARLFGGRAHVPGAHLCNGISAVSYDLYIW